MKYAVTGATGHFGQVAIKTLVEKVGADSVIALARNTEKATQLLPAGVEVLPGDYNQPDTLAQSLAGVDRLLFVSSQPGGDVARIEQHRNVVNAAKQVGVQLIAYTSYPHADQAVAPLADDHKATEALIKDSGLPYVFLRNNWYLENDRGVLQAVQQGQPFVYSADQGRAGWVLERLLAEAAAKVLILDAPKSIYELSGAPHTYADLAAAVQRVTGQTVDVQSVTDDQYQAGLEATGLDQPTAAIITSMQKLIRDGDLDEDSADLPQVLGADLPTLDAQVREVLGL